MPKIKKLHLKNFCGYQDLEFDFTKKGKAKNLVILIGENGVGKTSILDAIQLLSSASRYYGRNTTINFAKYTYNFDYDPAKQEYQRQLASQKLKRDENGKVVIDNTKKQYETDDSEYLATIMEGMREMEISGIWETPDGDKEVIVRTSGVVKDELYDGGSSQYHYFIQADSLSNMGKFQIEEERADLFLDLAETIYGYECSLGNKVDGTIGMEGAEKMYFYVDLILEKPWGDKVHFKRMSDGEKKIATLIRSLCDPTYMEEYDIVLIDNIAMHIYWKRHELLIKKLLSTFPEKQFILTTHSGILSKKTPTDNLYDVGKYKVQEAKKLGITSSYRDIQKREKWHSKLIRKIFGKDS